MPITEIVTKFLSTLTLLGGLLVIFYILFYRGEKTKHFKGIFDFFKKNATELAFIVALLATLGSLFYSEIAGFTPCILCWYQRIFMYPLVLILGVSLVLKDRRVYKYVAPMAIVGAAIALYHYIVQVTKYVGTCGVNSAVPCTVKYTFTYGYISIPMMALTAFILIFIGMVMIKRK